MTKAEEGAKPTEITNSSLKVRHSSFANYFGTFGTSSAAMPARSFPSIINLTLIPDLFNPFSYRLNIARRELCFPAICSTPPENPFRDPNPRAL
jgi:hypothetical protein